MKKYLSFFKIRFINSLQYRAAAFAGIFTQFVWGFMEILLYSAFYNTDPAAFPMEFSQLASYVWLKEAFLAMFATYYFDNETFDAIMSGNIAYELARPVNLYDLWFVKNLALRCSRAVLRCIPILLVAVLLPKPYGLSAPAGPDAFLAFLITLLLASFVLVSFLMFLYISAFYTINVKGMRMIVTSAAEFLTGAIIPLPFFPPSLRRIVELTPFAAMENIPFRIYSGNITGTALRSSVLLQIFWLILLTALGKAAMRRALRRVIVQGG